MKRREATFEASMPEAFVNCFGKIARTVWGHPPTMDKNNNVLFRFVRDRFERNFFPWMSHRAIHSLIHLFNVLDFEPERPPSPIF